jgi:hypothetical protein
MADLSSSPAAPKLKVGTTKTFADVYGPLQGLQIRLLKIHPRNANDRTTCTLTTVDLSKNPVFNVFSYVWGEQNDQSIISLDGKGFLVGKHLFDILLLCSSEADPESVSWWIDANMLIIRLIPNKILRKLEGLTSLL